MRGRNITLVNSIISIFVLLILPNIILQCLYSRFSARLGGYQFGMDFATWMGFGLPVSFLMVTLSWVWLQITFIGFR